MARWRRREFVKPKTNAPIRDGELDITVRLSDNGQQAVIEGPSDRVLSLLGFASDRHAKVAEEVRKRHNESNSEESANKLVSWSGRFGKLYHRAITRAGNLKFGRDRKEKVARWPFPVSR